MAEISKRTKQLVMNIELINYILSTLSTLGIITIAWCMKTAKPEPAKVIEHEPTISTVAAFEIDDIRIIEETGEVIVTYMPEFSY
jgi:hypothetical protein